MSNNPTGWVRFGRITIDPETETETFERIDPPQPVGNNPTATTEASDGGEAPVAALLNEIISVLKTAGCLARCGACGGRGDRYVKSAGYEGQATCPNCGGTGLYNIMTLRTTLSSFAWNVCKPVKSKLAEHDAEAARLREALRGLAELIPTSWLDSLLTGPDAVIGKPPYSGSDIETLLRAVKKRVADAAARSVMKGEKE